MKKSTDNCIDCDSSQDRRCVDEECGNCLRQSPVKGRSLAGVESLTPVQNSLGVTKLQFQRDLSAFSPEIGLESRGHHAPVSNELAHDGDSTPWSQPRATNHLVGTVDVKGLAVSLAIPGLTSVSSEWIREFGKARGEWRTLNPGADIDHHANGLHLKSLPLYKSGRLRIKKSSLDGLKEIQTGEGIWPRAGSCEAPEGLSWNGKQHFPDGKGRVFDPDLFWLWNYGETFENAPDHSMTVNYGYSRTFDWGFARDQYVDKPVMLMGKVGLDIGSCEKILTAIVAARIMCERKISPDTAIADWLPYDKRDAMGSERSLQAHDTVMGTSFRTFLHMESGLDYYANKNDPLFSKLPGTNKLEGYRYLQQDTSASPAVTTYSNVDYASIRYPLYHLAGNPIFTGPVSGYSDAQWRAWIINYDKLVGIFMTKQMQKYIFGPLGIKDVGWGYPEFGYVEGGYNIMTGVPPTLPLYYPAKSPWSSPVKGINAWVQDRIRGAGYGGMRISTNSFAKIISALAKGQLVSDKWRKEMQATHLSGALGYYGWGLHVTYDKNNERYFHHGGSLGNTYGMRSKWIIFPYASVQAFLINNHAVHVSTSKVIKAYWDSWYPKIPSSL